MTNICETLYQTYYKNQKGFSHQTSQHWKAFGEHQQAKKNGDDFDLQGLGFGDFIPNTKIRSLLSIPTQIYVTKMLKQCDQDIINQLKWVAKHQERAVSYDLSRMALTINLLRKHITDLEKKTFCIIGDGYGSLGTLLKKVFPESKIIFVNLGRTLLFDAYYTRKCFPTIEHVLIRDKQQNFCNDFNYIEAEHFKDIELIADVFINIVSMQEMNYDAITSYFKAMRNQPNQPWFYCCNRISKTLPDDSVINLADYGWSSNDKVIFDELCPWQQKFPVNRPPFLIAFDGPIQHKLALISPI